MGVTDLLRESWLIALDWLGGRELGRRRIVTFALLSATVGALFGGSQLAQAATPQWTAAVSKSNCGGSTGSDTLDLALANASTSPVLFTLYQNQYVPGSSGITPPNGVPGVNNKTQGEKQWQQPVAAGQSAHKPVYVAPADQQLGGSTVNYFLYVNDYSGGQKGRVLRTIDGSTDACANQPGPAQQALNWAAQQGAVGIVQLMAGAAQGLMSASSALINNSDTANGDKITNAAGILSQVYSTGAEAGNTRYGMMRGMGMVIMLVLLVLVIIASVIKRQPGEPIASLFIWAPLAMIAGGVVFFFADAIIGAVDGLTQWMVTPEWTGVQTYLQSVQNVYDPSKLSAAQGWQLGIVFVGSFLTLLASIVIFIVLQLRALAIAVMILFVPLAFAGLVSPWTRNWTMKVIEGFIALVFSKFVMLVLLATGISALTLLGGDMATPALAGAGANGTEQASSISGIISAFGLLLVVAFSPMFAMRLIPMARGHLEGAMSGAGHGGEVTGGMHQSAAQVYQRIRQPTTAGAAAVGGAAGGAATKAASTAGSKAKQGVGAVARQVPRLRGGETNEQVQRRETKGMQQMRQKEFDNLRATRADETPDERQQRWGDELQRERERGRSWHQENESK